MHSWRRLYNDEEQNRAPLQQQRGSFYSWILQQWGKDQEGGNEYCEGDTIPTEDFEIVFFDEIHQEFNHE